MRKIILGLAAAAALATPLVASAANASVTINPDGEGFVGKGDVQTVLGLNNSAMQKAVTARTIKFTATAPASQSLTQDVTQNVVNAGMQMGVQTATQTATQELTMDVSQDLSCTIEGKNKTFHRDGVRDGERTGTREGTREGQRDGTRYGARLGTRTGDRTGTLSGALVSDLNVENKKTGQYTGWFLNGWGKDSPVFGSTEIPVWNAPTFDATTFGEYGFADWTYNLGGFNFGGYTFTDTFEAESGIEWGGWDAAPQENPADCLRGAEGQVTDLVNTISEGDVTEGTLIQNDVKVGDTEPGALVGWYTIPAGTTYGEFVPGTATATGASTLLVNGKVLPITPAL